MISRIADPFLSLAFPQACHVCRNKVRCAKYGVACEACWDSTRLFSGDDTLCDKCSMPLATVGSTIDARCRQCDDLAFDRAVVCGVYENALSAAVLNLKKVPKVPAILVDQIGCSTQRAGVGNFDIVVPVPLSPKRRTDRGYNQAEVIAAHISKLTALPLDAHSLVRTIHTPMHRAGMDRNARESTVKNAFEVLRPKLIEARSVLLVDDILTSGATASSCALALKKNGAAEVNLFTLARAVTLY